MSKSMSGIKVSPEVAELFNKVKLNKIHKFVGFKITDDKKKVVIDEDFSGEPQTNPEEDENCFNEFKKRILACEFPRYLLFDFNFLNPEGRLINKVAFFNWCKDDCPVGQKMIYSSTKDTVKKVFDGVSFEFQVNEAVDLDYEELKKEVIKKS